MMQVTCPRAQRTKVSEANRVAPEDVIRSDTINVSARLAAPPAEEEIEEAVPVQLAR